MSSATMREAAALALRSQPSALQVSFFGGEPLLATSFVAEAVEHFEREARRLAPAPALSFVMNTNGTLFDEEALRLLAPPRRFLVNVSLDGAAELHDRFRLTTGGKATHGAVVRGIAKLRQASIPFQILSVVRPEGARDLGRTLAEVLDLEPLKAQLSIDYRAAWTDEAVAQLRAGLRDAGEVWMARFRAGRAIPCNPMHGKILAHLHGGMPCPSRCLLGDGELTVAPTGRLYPCAQMVGEDDDTSLCIGDVTTGVEPRLTERLRAAKDRVEETCSPCDLRDRCQSQCGCRHLALSGELGKVTAALCETEAAFIDEADRVAETLHAERCPAFMAFYYERRWGMTPGSKLTELRLSPRLGKSSPG